MHIHHTGPSRSAACWRRLCTTVAGLGLLVALAGCSQDTPSPTQASRDSAAQGEQLATLLPELLEVADDGGIDLEIKRAREQSCLDPADGDPQTETNWLGWASDQVRTAGGADSALDRLDAHLEAEGWVKDNEVVDGSAHNRALYFSKGDWGLTAQLTTTDAGHSLEILVSTKCRTQPEEHRMQRLDIDPGYGKNSQYYDDWK